MQNVCQKYTTASKTSLVLSLETFNGAMLGILILGEIFTFRLVVGGVTILLAIFISEMNMDFLFKKIKKNNA